MSKENLIKLLKEYKNVNDQKAIQDLLKKYPDLENEIQKQTPELSEKPSNKKVKKTSRKKR